MYYWHIILKRKTGPPHHQCLIDYLYNNKVGTSGFLEFFESKIVI